MPDIDLTASAALRTLTARPGRGTRAVAKTISRMAPEIVVPAAADPAVLVDLHSDLRLSLTTLAKDVGATFAEHQVVSVLSTGCIELCAADNEDDSDNDGEFEGLRLRIDNRARLRLTAGIVRRLAVPVGSKVLVTCQPAQQTLRLINLATLADAFDAHLASANQPT